VADVPGVLVAGVPVPVLDVDGAMQAIAQGVAGGGMAAKLQAGIAALHQGVERVRIGDLDAILDPDRGTILTPSRSFV
jgi:acetylglutamate kinase